MKYKSNTFPPVGIQFRVTGVTHLSPSEHAGCRPLGVTLFITTTEENEDGKESVVTLEYRRI